jgi:hypothetical protein
MNGRREEKMENVRTRVWEKVRARDIAWFVGLLAVVVVVPHYVHNQFITGPIVNAVLFTAAITVGVGNAILIGLFPSVVALVSGLLPAPLAPMIPFIMISNAIMVLTFSYIKRVNYWGGIMSATLFKYAFLYFTSTIVVGLISNHNIAVKAAATMMAWPQIVTAIVGGIIAFGVLKLYENYSRSKS